MKGLLNLRGQIVTSIDLRTRLQIEKKSVGLSSAKGTTGQATNQSTDQTLEEIEEESKADYMNIIVNHNGEFFSLMVDSVGDVVTVAKSRFSPSLPTLDENWKQCCRGVYQLEKQLLVIIEVAELLKINH